MNNVFLAKGRDERQRSELQAEVVRGGVGAFGTAFILEGVEIWLIGVLVIYFLFVWAARPSVCRPDIRAGFRVGCRHILRPYCGA